MKKKRTVASQAAARGPLPALPEGLLDDLVRGPMTPDLSAFSWARRLKTLVLNGPA
ncbi:hypothetical protein [Paraburkholderia aromaticivorans]|nr:hypothetical protein [Paraburkholderia aromaticivorans]